MKPQPRMISTASELVLFFDGHQLLRKQNDKPETTLHKPKTENTITNCQLVNVPYSTVFKAIEATDSDPFTMTICCKVEWAAIAQCVNQGIDSHLEACFVSGKDKYDVGKCLVSPESLCTLLRRLGDTYFNATEEHSQEDLWEAAMSLQSSIFIVLGIDDFGNHVGREAMGLE